MFCLQKKSGSHTFEGSDGKGDVRSESISVKEERREGIHGATKEDDEDTNIGTYVKTNDDMTLIKTAISKNEFMKSILKDDQIDLIVDAMYLRDVAESEIIITEGESGSHLYVSAEGTYCIIIGDKKVGTFNDSRVFGELAILYKAKRLATIKVITSGKVWVINRNVYQKIIVQSAKKDYEEILLFLRNVPTVNKLNDVKLKKLSLILKSEFFTPDSVIVEEGHVGDKFYIIRAGNVSVTKDKVGKVAELKRGDFFGELALLQEDKRQATVTATIPGAECLTLTRNQFLEHFDANVFENDQANKAEDTKFLENVVIEDKIKNMDLDDFKRVQTLGVGGFGRVELIQHKEHKQSFALKYLKKIDVLDNHQVDHAFNEKEIHIKCNSIFIVRLYKTYRDKKYLYFLMECCLGGDLWTQLRRQRGYHVNDSAAKFYSGCVLEALSYLHERGCVYRDLKPENLLIDSKGYLKLTDFGFAKVVNDRTYTFAGTPEYVAPEIIYNRGHDKAVDYWSFGIFIYELLVGRTPFRSNDPTHMKTYQNILKGMDYVVFPKTVSVNATDMIKKLCKALPNNRLGYQKQGTQAIRAHKWYGGFDWMKLRACKLKAPFVPKLASNIDTKYFDIFGRDDDVPPDEVSGWDKEF